MCADCMFLGGVDREDFAAALGGRVAEGMGTQGGDLLGFS